MGNAAFAGKLQIAAGAFTFITCACGWWIFLAIMLASLDFPIQLPGKSPVLCGSIVFWLTLLVVGDLSTLIKPMSQKMADKEA